MTVLNLKSASITLLGEPLPFDVQLNTNDNITTTTSEVYIKKPGIYKITGMVTLTSTTTGVFGISTVVNGEIYKANSTSNYGDDAKYTTFPLLTVIKVDKSNNNEFVKVQFNPMGSSVCNGGNIVIEKVS